MILPAGFALISSQRTNNVFPSHCDHSVSLANSCPSPLHSYKVAVVHQLQAPSFNSNNCNGFVPVPKKMVSSSNWREKSWDYNHNLFTCLTPT